MTNEVETTKQNVKQPARLEITDLPRDKNRVLGSLRQGLCASFNYCRRYTGKLEVLRDNLEVVLERVNAELEYQATQTKEVKEGGTKSDTKSDTLDDETKPNDSEPTGGVKPDPVPSAASTVKTAVQAPKSVQTATQTPLTTKESK